MVFAADLLRKRLLPTLETLLQTSPECIPFREPVDPVRLAIPDYFDIVKRPMDLATIRHKLETGAYADPWGYVDDVWLMFENAWLYNRRTSQVYRYCTKLSEVFEEVIDPVMQAMGYCCGRKYVFNPQVLYCYAKQLCIVPRDAKYYSYQNRYIYCQKCFDRITEDSVTVGDDPDEVQSIKKNDFMVMRNNHVQLEPFITCPCGRKLHQICVRHLPNSITANTIPFPCDYCNKKRGIIMKENPFTAVNLPRTQLDTCIEDRVRYFLKRKRVNYRSVHIRIVSSADHHVEVKPGMKARFVPGRMQAKYPYRAKALFAFQEIDGVDVCFFGMNVQEYGSDCPPPNNRRLYIAYLDSVHYFRPRELRTDVYHEILLGYLSYSKKLGFASAHIWACPPADGDDYIFHSHPPEQKTPKPKRMQEWYKRMLEKAKRERIVYDYKDILQQAIHDRLGSPADIPYFDGDFWPNILEDAIKEVEEGGGDSPESSLLNLKTTEHRRVTDKGPATRTKCNPRKVNRKITLHSDDELTSKVFTMMEKHKSVFFVIQLRSPNAVVSNIHDPDPLMHCDLMDGRDGFIIMAREKNYEFSTLRRAKYSTMALLYELHNATHDRFVYNCDKCKSQIDIRYHCLVCPDFDLCVACFDREGHAHRMQKISNEGDTIQEPVNPVVTPHSSNGPSLETLETWRKTHPDECYLVWYNKSVYAKHSAKCNLLKRAQCTLKNEKIRQKIRLCQTQITNRRVASMNAVPSKLSLILGSDGASNSGTQTAPTPQKLTTPKVLRIIPKTAPGSLCARNERKPDNVTVKQLVNIGQRQGMPMQVDIPEHKLALLRGYNSVLGTNIHVKTNGGTWVIQKKGTAPPLGPPEEFGLNTSKNCTLLRVLSSNSPFTGTVNRWKSTCNGSANSEQDLQRLQAKRIKLDIPEHKLALLRGYNSILGTHAHGECRTTGGTLVIRKKNGPTQGQENVGPPIEHSLLGTTNYRSLTLPQPSTSSNFTDDVVSPPLKQSNQSESKKKTW